MSYQAGAPTDPLPAAEVAADFADHKASIDAAIDFSKLIQRSDGRLTNGSVRPESLSSGTLALIGDVSWRGGWVTATAYAVNDLATEDMSLYICLVAHTSGTFATDLAAGKWQLVEAAAATLEGDQTFTGTNEFDGATIFDGPADFNAAVTFDAAVDFDGAIDMTGGTPTVPTASAGDSDTSAASTAFVQAAVGKVYVQTFTATGTYTPHAGMVTCIVECWGGGGGGGGSAIAATGSQVAFGGGGGAGSYSRKICTAANIGASKTVTIGAAGTGGTAGNNAGGAGGDTSVGSLCVGKGGSGGGGNSGVSTILAAGGLGGIAGTGDATATGAPGGSGTASVGYIGAGGGSSSMGGGGVQPAGAAASATGAAATGRGAGGAGGMSPNGTSAAAGGVGTAGIVIITEFCNQ